MDRYTERQIGIQPDKYIDRYLKQQMIDNRAERQMDK